MGDGFLATFDGPARAIRCAAAIRDDTSADGLAMRGGLHTGEIEVRDDDVHGIAVHIEQISEDALRVEEGSLYPALHRIEQAGWIGSEWKLTENNRKAKYYRLTAAGRNQLAEEEEKWSRLTRAVGKVLKFA